MGLGADAEFAIPLCIEELFLNAVQHGRANRASVSVCAQSDGVVVEFADDGEPFDPTRAPVKRIGGRTRDFDIGGYGAALMKRFSRRMTYRHAEGLNRLVVEFDAGRGAGARPETLGVP